jgi:putative ABC transport system permease protein
VWDSFPQVGVQKIGVTYANFADLKERSHAFEPLALYAVGSTTTYNMMGAAGPEVIQATYATGDFFRALDVPPLLGRALETEDEEAGRNHVVVIGYNLWQRDFGGDPHVIGKPLKLSDEDFIIVGVMPAGFAFPSGREMPAGQQFALSTELWVPLTITNPSDARSDRTIRGYRAVARLKPGVTVEQAQTETNAIVRELVAEHPNENANLEVSVLTLRENQVGELCPVLLALLGAVGLVFLIACARHRRRQYRWQILLRLFA